MKLCLVLAMLALAAGGDSLSPPPLHQHLHLLHPPIYDYVPPGWMERLMSQKDRLPLLAKGNPRLCEGSGRMVRQFSDRKEDTMMPCKYHALRQTTCGRYQVTITPGNVYLHPKYRLDSLWLGIKDMETSQEWEGRTDNKIAVKFLNGWKDTLFNQKDGGLSTEDVLAFGKDSSSTWAEAKNGDFRVTFVPWDPESDTFPVSTWSFECLSDAFQPSGYPQQICGGSSKRDVVKRAKELGLEGRQQVIHYDVFTDTSITQTNPKCSNATRIMTEVCTDQEQRTLAVATCSQVLASYKHTKCVTKYSCDPMDVFVDCLDWVCGGFSDPFACERVGRGIDMCREFKGGNLTRKVKDAKCFKDFLPIVD